MADRRGNGVLEIASLHPYEGMRLTAWPALTMSRGEVVWDGEKPRGDAGRGKFLACARPDPAKPRRRGPELPS